jgi:hypothetical protein
MVVRTVRFFTLIAMIAGLGLEVLWMELLLFPSMTIRAAVFFLASVLVRRNELLGRPIGAHLFVVREYLGFPSIVLPIVSIHTNVPFMVIFFVWTPDSLEMKEVEIHIRSELFY